MSGPRRDSTGADGPRRALDLARFGATGILDLHPLLPSAARAAGLVMAWVRERQLMGLPEALIITGRGKHSADGVSPVRDAVRGVFPRLLREGVIQHVVSQTEGSFVVQLAPVGQRIDANARRRDPSPPKAPPVRTLEGLSNETVEALEAYAARRLEQLGVTAPTSGQVIQEMGHVFSRLVGTHGTSEAALRNALATATRDLDEL